jgi:hypothetical protein
MLFQWLYRYIFRGIGLVFLAGMLTALFLAISSQTGCPERPYVPKQPTRPSVEKSEVRR